ncbi:MAG: hypothetical protein AB3N23_05660 [Paracoccaceae bacterium]
MSTYHTPLVLLSLTAGINFDSIAKSQTRQINDPFTGEAMALTDIDFTRLTRPAALDIVAQLRG